MIYLYFGYVRKWNNYCNDMVSYRNKMYVPWITYEIFEKELIYLIKKNELQINNEKYKLCNRNNCRYYLRFFLVFLCIHIIIILLYIIFVYLYYSERYL